MLEGHWKWCRKVSRSRGTEGQQFACAKMCIEVDLEKVLPFEIVLIQGEWKHILPLDYDKLLFKC